MIMYVYMYVYIYIKYVYVYQYHIAKEGQVFYGRYIHTWMGLSTNKHN